MKQNNKYVILVAIILIGMFMKSQGIFFAVGELANPITVTITLQEIADTKCVAIVPSTTSPLIACLGSNCKTITEGEYIAGSTIQFENIISAAPTLDFTWNRMKDSQGRIDAGITYQNPKPTKCLASVGNQMYVSDGSVYYNNLGQRCYTPSGLPHLGVDTPVTSTQPFWTTPYTQNYGRTTDPNDKCRITEQELSNPIALGGASAQLSNFILVKQPGSTYSDAGNCVATTCVEGYPLRCPTDLCQNAKGTLKEEIVFDETGTKTITQNGITLIVNWDVSALKGDSDEDGLSNQDEGKYKTDPLNKDTDGDGMFDGWEVLKGLNPLVNDALEDPDQDGISNLNEFLQGTEPKPTTPTPTTTPPTTTPTTTNTTINQTSTETTNTSTTAGTTSGSSSISSFSGSTPSTTPEPSTPTQTTTTTPTSGTGTKAIFIIMAAGIVAMIIFKVKKKK